MADPITWGLINLVKKGVKGVQTTLDGVSDKVSSLPDSLDTDFTEVKEAIVDVKVDVGSVNTSVGGVKEDTTSIKNTIDTNPLLKAGSAVKSVQRGIWIGNQQVDNLQTFTIANISQINPEKSILIINAAITNYEGTSNVKQAYILSENAISVKNTNGYNNNSYNVFLVDWQVIEFY